MAPAPSPNPDRRPQRTDERILLFKTAGFFLDAEKQPVARTLMPNQIRSDGSKVAARMMKRSGSVGAGDERRAHARTIARSP